MPQANVSANDVVSPLRQRTADEPSGRSGNFVKRETLCARNSLSETPATKSGDAGIRIASIRLRIVFVCKANGLAKPTRSLTELCLAELSADGGVRSNALNFKAAF